MSVEINYTNLPDRQAALDFVQYLGFRRSCILARIARTSSEQIFAFYANFAGVSGKPVAVAYKRWSRQ